MQLKIDFPLKRMLVKDEAATYCSLPKARFGALCPVRPVKLHESTGDVWDIRDLDQWLDRMKNGRSDLTDDEIVSKLG